MGAQGPRSPRVKAGLLFLCLLLGGVWGQAQEATSPTRLSHVAKGIKLRLPPGVRKLDNEAMKKLGEDVVLTTSKQKPAGTSESGSGTSKGYWQNRYQEARARVLGLELFIQRVQQRLQKAQVQEAEAVVLQRNLRRAERELELMRGAPENVRRQALEQGASPDWFTALPPPEPSFPSWVEAQGQKP